MKSASTISRIPRLLLAVVITFLLALLFLYLTPTELLILFLAAAPGGFIERKLLKAILAGLLGVLLATLLAFLILLTSSPSLLTAVQTIPDLFTISLLLPAIMGALGAGIGAEIWHLSLRQVQPQEVKQSRSSDAVDSHIIDRRNASLRKLAGIDVQVDPFIREKDDRF